VGAFPNWDVWAEWNGRYRDDIRKFIKGDAGEGGRRLVGPGAKVARGRQCRPAAADDQPAVALLALQLVGSDKRLTSARPSPAAQA
jgi:hypothetical protein